MHAHSCTHVCMCFRPRLCATALSHACMHAHTYAVVSTCTTRPANICTNARMCPGRVHTHFWRELLQELPHANLHARMHSCTHTCMQLCSELHAMLTRLGHISAEETTGVRVVAVKDEDDDEWIGLPALDALPSGGRACTRACTHTCTHIYACVRNHSHSCLAAHNPAHRRCQAQA